MTVNELVLTSLEGIENFHLDLGTKTKQLTKEAYLQFADYEVENYYLDMNKETNQPCIVLKLKDY